jgi:hypothetical protein
MYTRTVPSGGRSGAPHPSSRDSFKSAGSGAGNTCPTRTLTNANHVLWRLGNKEGLLRTEDPNQHIHAAVVLH